jgi:hypothetical protein
LRVHEEYLTLIKSEKRENMEAGIKVILKIIGETIKASEETSHPKTAEDFTKILTNIELNNLKMLSRKMETSLDYFLEKTKPVAERTFFLMSEVIPIP